jgi:hypothetical protein
MTINVRPPPLPHTPRAAFLNHVGATHLLRCHLANDEEWETEWFDDRDWISTLDPSIVRDAFEDFWSAAAYAMEHLGSTPMSDNDRDLLRLVELMIYPYRYQPRILIPYTTYCGFVRRTGTRLIDDEPTRDALLQPYRT